jgi:predicted permease
MESFFQDVKYAIRMILKKPGFTIVAVLSLTLGIGANATIFTLVKAVFLQTVPIKEPGSVMVVYSTAASAGGGAAARTQFLPLSYLNAVDYKQENSVFQNSSIIIPMGVNLVQNGKQTGLFCLLVNAEFFDLLGVQPAMGRSFHADEDQAERPVAIISYTVWKDQFGQDANIINKTAQFGTQSYTIIGVLPEWLHPVGPMGNPDVYIPLAMRKQVLTGLLADWVNQRGARMVFMYGRLKPGVTQKQADANLQNLSGELTRLYPTANKGRGVMMLPIADTLVPPQQRGDFVQAGTLMMVIVGLVLLIACANVANLLLARATQRQREIAVRQSLGAKRFRLVRQLLTESFILALLSAILGVICAFQTRTLITHLLPQGTLPPDAAASLTVDSRVLLFTLGLSVLATMLFGLMPAVQSSRSDRLASLRDRTDLPSGHTRWYGLRGALVMVQVALSLVALVGAGLFIHSMRNAQKIDPGFEVQHELIAGINLAAENYSPAQAEQFYRDSVERVKALPMVADAGYTDHPPFGAQILRTAFTEDADPSNPRNGHPLPFVVAQPGWFSAAGMVMERGRGFTEHDDKDAPMVMVVNRAAADELWPGKDPLSHHLKYLLTNWNIEVVGVVNTVKFQTLGEDPQPIVYVPMKQHTVPGTFMWIRTKGTPDDAIAGVRNAIKSLDPAPLRNLRPVSFFLDQSLAAPKLGAELLGGFGVLALILAAMGTYGVMSYSVSQRTQEIGIRLAMGAQREDVLRLIVGGGMAMVGVGVLAGLVFSTLLTNSMHRLLYGIGFFDPAAFLATAAMLVVVALVACWIPARRASRVDPMVALRYE